MRGINILGDENIDLSPKQSAVWKKRGGQSEQVGSGKKEYTVIRVPQSHQCLRKVSIVSVSRICSREGNPTAETT